MQDYSQVFEITKKRAKMPKIIIILAIIILIGVTVYFFLTLMPFNILKPKFDVSYPNVTYYAVSIASSDNKEDMTKLYANAKAIGASGYVWELNNIYYLLALVYPREDMAQSVVASNNLSDFTLEIVPITTPAIEFNLEEYSSQDIDTINEIANFIYDLGSAMYELTIAVEMNNISSVAGASTINNHKGELTSYIARLQNILATNPNDNVAKLQEKTIALVAILEKLVNELLINSNSTSSMKYEYCEYLFELIKE